MSSVICRYQNIIYTVLRQLVNYVIVNVIKSTVFRSLKLCGNFEILSWPAFFCVCVCLLPTSLPIIDFRFPSIYFFLLASIHILVSLTFYRVLQSYLYLYSYQFIIDFGLCMLLLVNQFSFYLLHFDIVLEGF